MGHFTRSLNHRPLETRAGTRSRSRGWKGQRTNNAPSRSTRRSGHSILASAAFRLRAYDRNLICGEHYGQRPKISAASTGRTHGSTDQLCITVKNPLPTGSRPHMATSRHSVAQNRLPLHPQQRTFRGPRWTSAFDPKATFDKSAWLSAPPTLLCRTSGGDLWLRHVPCPFKGPRGVGPNHVILPANPRPVALANRWPRWAYS